MNRGLDPQEVGPPSKLQERCIEGMRSKHACGALAGRREAFLIRCIYQIFQEPVVMHCFAKRLAAAGPLFRRSDHIDRKARLPLRFLVSTDAHVACAGQT